MAITEYLRNNLIMSVLLNGIYYTSYLPTRQDYKLHHKVMTLCFRINSTSVETYMNHIKKDLTDMGCEDVHWIHMVDDRAQWQVPVSTVTKVKVPRS